jgi:hypothetical protein
MDKKKAFRCNFCNYKTTKKSNYIRHNLSTKHNDNSCVESDNKYNCLCGKRYKGRDGLWRHQQKCVYFIENEDDGEVEEEDDDEYDVYNEEDDDEYDVYNEDEDEIEVWKDMIKTLMDQNTEWQSKYTELQKMLIEEGKEFRNTIANMQSQSNITNNINNINNINNNTFNLQFFLNETCKDAMNIDEFIDSIQITIEDLKYLGKKGYVEGMSNLFMKNLEELDISQRPLHCSDIKRESIYIKDKNVWNKESDQKSRLTNVATDITRLHTITLQNDYQKAYPNCLIDTKSKEHEEYGKIAYEAFGGKMDIDKANQKLFRNIMKFVVINKNKL